MQNILVTGGAGYIGSHTCKALAEAGFTPVVFDNLSAGRPDRVKWGPLVQGDITDIAALQAAVEEHKPIAVMHFAGQISVPDSVKNPEYTYHINTQGSLNLLKVLHAHGIKHMVFSSTAAAYGIPETTPIPESAPKKPINPYGHSKLMTEQMMADYATAYNTTYAVLRYFNAAGATPEAGLGYLRPNPFHLVPMCMLAALEKTPPLNLFGTDYPTPDGTAVRDYIHVADLAEAHVLALQHLLKGGESLTLNLGTSQGYSVKQVLEMCAEVIGHQVPHTTGPRRAGDPPALVANAEKAQTMLNWKPTRSSLKNIITTDWAWHSALGNQAE